MSIEQEIQEVAGRVNHNRLWEAQKGSLNRHRANHASRLSHPCVRALWYDRTAPEAKLAPSVRRAFIFQLGHIFEREARHEVERAGYQVLPPLQAYEYPEHHIVGSLDGLLIMEHTCPWECKSVERHEWERIVTIDDLLNSPKWWMRGYPSQVNLYCLLAGYEHGGILWLKSKHTFEHKALHMPLDLDLAEKCLKAAEAVNAAIVGGEPPPRLSFDASVCGLCDYRASICGPPQPPRPVVTDAEILAFLAEHERLKEFSSKYTKSQARLKEYFPEEAVVMAGPFEVTVTKNKKGTLMRRVRNLLETKEEE